MASVGSAIVGGKDQSRPPNVNNPGYNYYNQNPGMWDAIFAQPQFDPGRFTNNFPTQQPTVRTPIMVPTQTIKTSQQQGKQPTKTPVAQSGWNTGGRVGAALSGAPAGGTGMVGGQSFSMGPAYGMGQPGYGPVSVGGGYTAPAFSSGAAAGAGASGGSVLCSHYMRRGWLDKRTRDANRLYASYFAPEYYAGYRFFADPILARIEKGNWLLELAIWPIVKAWAKESRKRVLQEGPGSWFGALLEWALGPLVAKQGRKVLGV